VITFRLTISPQSYLLCSNAETSSTLDSQFVFDQNGFPYFPAKTFKGLLRESMIEVLEIEGKEVEIAQTINTFFGIEGDQYNNGLLNIPNLYLSGYNDQDPYFKSANRHSKYDIQNYYLCRIQQTALDDHEIAKDTSLRTYGVLNYERAKCFEALLDFKSLSEGQEKTLQRAIDHLRHAGTRRNRGFGKIKCTLTDKTIRETNSTTKLTWKDNWTALSVNIKLREPVVLGTQNADTNTVFSQDFIAGSQVLGMLAWAYPDKESPDFKDLFLKDNLRFGACYPQTAQPLPLSIHKEKYEPEAKYHNLLAGTSAGKVTKGIGGFISPKGQVTPDKHFNFHSSRIERSAGRSVKDQITGGIFYYEALAKGLVFEGQITGKIAALKKLYEQYGGTTEKQMGKSKSSQYGNVELTIEPVEADNATVTIGTYYMVAQSPIILFNDFGYPSPTQKELTTALGGNVTISDEATATIIPIELYNSSWLAKSGKVMAFKEGSTFKVEAKAEIAKHQTIGEWQNKGFGKVKFLSEAEMSEYMTWLKVEKNKTGDESPSIPDIVKQIDTEIEKLNTQESIRKKGHDDARKYAKKFSNSLIGRITRIMELTTESAIEQFFKDIKGKLAEKALSKEHLYDDLCKTSTLLGKYENHAQYKIYWAAFFEYLRKANNTK
jgi:CRISPR-associated protein Csx10